MTEKVLRLWLSALTVAVIAVSFLTVSMFRSRFEFLKVYRLEVIGQGGTGVQRVTISVKHDGQVHSSLP